MSEFGSLEDFRDAITDADEDIFDAFGWRFELTDGVAVPKHTAGLPTENIERRDERRQAWMNGFAARGLDAALGGALFDLVHPVSCERQDVIRANLPPVPASFPKA